MKRLSFLFLIFVLSSSSIFAQELPDLSKIKLRKNNQYKPAEETVNQVINYLFSTPINAKSKERQLAGEFLLKWMNGTPDHTFYIEEKETSFFNTDSDLLLMYMAGLAKHNLAHPEIKKQKDQVLGALAITIPYLNAQDNKNSWNKELWQLNDAFQKGRLQAYLYK